MNSLRCYNILEQYMLPIFFTTAALSLAVPPFAYNSALNTNTFILETEDVERTPKKDVKNQSIVDPRPDPQSLP